MIMNQAETPERLGTHLSSSSNFSDQSLQKMCEIVSKGYRRDRGSLAGLQWLEQGWQIGNHAGQKALKLSVQGREQLEAKRVDVWELTE